MRNSMAGTVSKKFKEHNCALYFFLIKYYKANLKIKDAIKDSLNSKNIHIFKEKHNGLQE